MTFGLYNNEFEAVVSGDDGSFIAVWDIETGKLMSKFGEAHGVSKDSIIPFRKPRSLRAASILHRGASLQQEATGPLECGTLVTASA